MAQVNTHDQKMAELAKHKYESISTNQFALLTSYCLRNGHISYWKAQNKQTDPKVFEDGFIQGWVDAENSSLQNINRDSMLSQRREEHKRNSGYSNYDWAFNDG